jgi:hypothetical protein
MFAKKSTCKGFAVVKAKVAYAVCSCVSMQEQGASWAFSPPDRSILLHRTPAANRRSGWSVVSGQWAHLVSGLRSSVGESSVAGDGQRFSFLLYGCFGAWFTACQPVASFSEGGCWVWVWVQQGSRRLTIGGCREGGSDDGWK